MQKWGFFTMGAMAGIIVVLVMALMAQHQSQSAFAARPDVAVAGGEPLIMATGGTQQQVNDMVWVLYKHAPIVTLKEISGDTTDKNPIQHTNRISLLLYKMARNGEAMKFVSARDLSFDAELIDYKQESPTVGEIYTQLKRQIKEK